MLSYTANTLQKLEALLRIKNYKIRYEKGNFESGTCTLLKNKILVINKFSDIEMKINSVAEVVAGLDFSEITLNDKQKKFLYLVKQTKLDL